MTTRDNGAAGGAGDGPFDYDTIATIVLSCVAELTGEAADLDAQVDAVFTTSQMIRNLLELCQDVVAQHCQRFIDLASGSEEEMADFGALSFDGLVLTIMQRAA